MASSSAPNDKGTGSTRSSGATSVKHALEAAEENERALQSRLHRVHDPKGMELLRGLRAHIADLKAQIKKQQTR